MTIPTPEEITAAELTRTGAFNGKSRTSNHLPSNDRSSTPTSGRLDITLMCQWFMRCTRRATTTMPHPVLGAVPICQHCHDIVKDL